jgi:ketosteroid isomerase-like protein
MSFTRILALFLTHLVVIPPAIAGAGQDPTSAAEGFVEALSRADLPAVLEYFTDDATLFAPFPEEPVRVEGKEAIAALFEPMFSRLHASGEGPVYMSLTPRDLDTKVLGDTAVVTFHLGRIPQEPLPEPYSFSRRTLVLHRTAGRWEVVHLHASSVIIPASDPEPGS